MLSGLETFSEFPYFNGRSVSDTIFSVIRQDPIKGYEQFYNCCFANKSSTQFTKEINANNTLNHANPSVYQFFYQ